MRIDAGSLDGLILVTPKAFTDDRGFFLEAYRRDAYAALGIDPDFMQMNHSRSVPRTIRGRSTTNAVAARRSSYRS